MDREMWLGANRTHWFIEEELDFLGRVTMAFTKDPVHPNEWKFTQSIIWAESYESIVLPRNWIAV